MAVRFLHFSDIHFYAYKDNSWNLDENIKNEVYQDLKRIMESEMKTVDHILVCGDVAFSGLKEEYEVASDWIENICLLTNCEQYNVLIVPGNHDIDRKCIDNSQACLYLRNKLKQKARGFHSEFLKIWFNEADKESLMLPLSNYYSFVKKYGVDGSNIMLDKYININDKYKIRIRGMNSAFLCYDPKDENDEKVISVGEVQANILTEDNVIHMSMMHHPIHWLKDGDIIKKYLDARTSIQLYGHEHVSKATFEENILKIYSGAMQPSRKENDWHPTFNIIDMDIVDDYLSVKINSRGWTDDLIFDEMENIEYKIPLVKERQRHNNKIKTYNDKVDTNHPHSVSSNIVNSDNFRYAYYNIKKPLDQIKIGKELNVLKDEDNLLDLLDIVDVIYDRLEEQDRLDELLTVINSR